MKPDYSWLDKVVPVRMGNVNRGGGRLHGAVAAIYNIKYQGKISRRRLFVAKYRPLICFYCEIKLELLLATVDHVTPSSKGGTDTISNKVFACAECNGKKADRMPTQKELDKLKNWRIITHESS